MLRLIDDGELEFPRSVFVSPGDQHGGGYSFSAELVNNQSEYDAALKAGFFATIPEAIEAFRNPKPIAEKKPKKEPKEGATIPEAKGLPLKDGIEASDAEPGEDTLA